VSSLVVTDELSQYTVYEPNFDSNASAIIEAEISRSDLSFSSPRPDLASKVRSDPLAKLPDDIMFMIFDLLSVDDALALIQASWHAYMCSCDNLFWKRMLRQQESWFWEAEGFLNTHRENAKAVFFWLEKATAPRFGMESPLMGIANRRRIIRVCERIKSLYQWRAAEKQAMKDEEDEEDEEAEEILEAGQSLQMPMTKYPEPKGSTTTYRQWIRSWDELFNSPKGLETFWTAGGELAGIAVTVGSGRRTFGQHQTHGSGIVSHRVAILASDWITEIVLHVRILNPYDKIRSHQDGDPTPLLSTVGLSVRLSPFLL
jgi:hypothetical protein